MYTVKNISNGPRGFHQTTDAMGAGQVMLDKGQTAEGVVLSEGELKSAKATGYFEITKSKAKGKDAPAGAVIVPAPTVAELEGKTDDELRDLVKDKLGDLAPADADRAEMLALLAD